MSSAPSRSVLERFGARGEPIALAGGEGVSFRVGDIVVKRVHDDDETTWTQQLLSRVSPDGFRIATPIPTLDGEWVHECWSASRFVDGLRPAAPSWAAITDAGLRLADAAELVRDGGRDVLSRRSHRWAVADRVAWSEQEVELRGEAGEIHLHARSLLSEVRADEHFVHGDLSGNVFFDGAGIPVILDISPYLRPRRWAAAIVIADAVLWHGAPLSLARSFAATSSDLDLFARALIFRLVAEQLDDHPPNDALGRYRSVVVAVS